MSTTALRAWVGERESQALREHQPTAYIQAWQEMRRELDRIAAEPVTTLDSSPALLDSLMARIKAVSNESVEVSLFCFREDGMCGASIVGRRGHTYLTRSTQSLTLTQALIDRVGEIEQEAAVESVAGGGV